MAQSQFDAIEDNERFASSEFEPPSDEEFGTEFKQRRTESDRHAETTFQLDREINVTLTEDDIYDQTSRLQEEIGVSEDVANRLGDVFEALIREEVKEQGKDWGDEAIEAVANLTIAMTIQEDRQREPL